MIVPKCGELEKVVFGLGLFNSKGRRKEKKSKQHVQRLRGIKKQKKVVNYGKTFRVLENI